MHTVLRVLFVILVALAAVGTVHAIDANSIILNITYPQETLDAVRDYVNQSGEYTTVLSILGDSSFGILDAATDTQYTLNIKGGKIDSFILGEAINPRYSVVVNPAAKIAIYNSIGNTDDLKATVKNEIRNNNVRITAPGFFDGIILWVVISTFGFL